MPNDLLWARIPLQRSPLGLLQVVAAIDRREVSLLVDTGANATVLDRERASRRGLVGQPSDLGTVGCVTVNGVAMLDGARLEIGSVRVEPPRVALVDLAHVNRQFEKVGAEPVDGVLGADVLGERSAVIEFSKPELRLRVD